MVWFKYILETKIETIYDGKYKLIEKKTEIETILGRRKMILILSYYIDRLGTPERKTKLCIYLLNVRILVE